MQSLRCSPWLPRGAMANGNTRPDTTQQRLTKSARSYSASGTLSKRCTRRRNAFITPQRNCRHPFHYSFKDTTMKRTSRLWLATAGLFLLAGCSTSTQPLKRPPLPANLAAPCPDIRAPAGAGWDDLGKAYIGLVGQYSDCAMRHDATVSLF